MWKTRPGIEKKWVEQLREQLSKASTWAPATLCLFVIACYGIYLLQSFRSGLMFASNYNQLISEVQVIESLYLFGKLGLIAHATVETGILLGYIRSGTIVPGQFMYLLALVIVSNLVIYAFISYLYGYAITIFQ